MTVKPKSKRNLFSTSSSSAAAAAAASSPSSVHIGEIDPKRRSEIQASAPQKPESFRRIRQNGGEMPVSVSAPSPPPTPPTLTATVTGLTTKTKISPTHVKPTSQKKILGKALGFVTHQRHGDNNSNNRSPTAAATAAASDVTSPTRKSPKRMVVSSRRKGEKKQQQRQDHHAVWGNNSNSTAPSTQSDSEHDQQRLISTGQEGGVEFAPAAAVAKKAAAAAAAAAAAGTGTAAARRSNRDVAAQASGSMSSETFSLDDDDDDDYGDDYGAPKYHESTTFHFPECRPGQIEQMSTLDENLRGVLVSSYSRDNYPDARPIVDESDYVSLASTLDTETISPLDEHEMMEMRQMRQENNSGSNSNSNSPSKKKKKKNHIQDRIKMNILKRKGSVKRNSNIGTGGKSSSEERWMNRSARDLNATSDNHPSPPNRRESLVRTNTKDDGDGGRKKKRSPSSPRDDSGIEVDEAIQVGFAVLRALKASGGSDEDGRSVKKDEIMNHLHSMISEVEESDSITASNAEKDDALDEVEECLDMHRSYSNSRSRSSKGSGSGGARSSSRSMYGDDAPAKPSRTRSKDDLELCGSGRDKESSNNTSEDRRSRRNNNEPTKTSKSAFRPARFSAKQKYNALDDADDAEDTAHTCGTVSVDMPSLVSVDDSSAMPDPEPRTQSSRRRPSVSATSRSQSCRNMMAALDGDDDDEIHAVTPKRGPRRGLREVRRSQSERHIAGADAAAGGVSPPRARSRSKSSRSVSNLNDTVEDEAPALRRGRREPRRSRSSSGQRGTSQTSSKLSSAENAPPSPRKGRRPTKAGRRDKSSPTDRTTGSGVSSKDHLERSDAAKSPRRNRSRSIASRRSVTPSAGNRSRSKDPVSAPRRSQLKRESRSARHLCANESSSASPLKRSMSTSASQLGMKTISMDRTRHNSLTAVQSSPPSNNIGIHPFNERQSEKMDIPPAQLSSPVKLSSNPRDTKSYYKHSPMSASAVSTRKSLLSHLPKSKSLRSLGDSIAFSSLENDTTSVAFTVGTQKSKRGVLGDAAIANMDWQKSNQK
eukprot:CAMPEP_0113485692 /NCGR_PEP_ID=MMETSP0014_2-20120614/24615_1 /TAXON_ID=2857 /ORGANISM="Nitzschia sp." /LENGTH=1047 /DNA_ID=CAMNT_0000379347 /DNA_START=17 /DNA_END=3160 /DNA_ORIENTATION=- /assembly_acc=CAM_ASM_000159